MFFRGEKMRHENTLDAANAALIVIDMQEAFRNSVGDFAETASRIATTVEGAKLLNVPVIVTEQYPKGLGHTAEEVRAALPEGIEVIEKSAFSSCGARSFEDSLERTDE